VPSLNEIVEQPPVETIEQIIARMQALDGALPVSDGISWFNRLYLRVSEGVQAALKTGGFLKPEFIVTLDVHFANLYFNAIRDYFAAPASTPRAWVPLFEARARRDIAPIQFALAGMNAHINRDLPVALVEAASALGSALQRPSPEYNDYEQVDSVLAKVETEVKAWFDTGFVGVIDRRFGPLDDVLASWSVKTARRAAWVNAEVLWSLRGSPALSADYLASLDRTIGFAGRGLLVPTAI
jgi:hypothetical protein